MQQTWEPAAEEVRSGKIGFTTYKILFLRRGYEGFLAGEGETECCYTKIETEGKGPCYSDKVTESVKEDLFFDSFVQFK